MSRRFLLLEEGVFSEDANDDTRQIIARHFDVMPISRRDILTGNVPNPLANPLRGSLALATRAGRDLIWTSARMWAPVFRDQLVSRDYYFNDLGSILERETTWPRFVRPDSGKKEFGGDVYSREKLEDVSRFLKQSNEEDLLLCFTSAPVPIDTEWRVIVVNGVVISGSRYMVASELSVAAECPSEVLDFARRIAAHPMFLNRFEFVIDVGLVEGDLRLVEINHFETASFYAADLDAIYAAWAKALDF